MGLVLSTNGCVGSFLRRYSLDSCHCVGVTDVIAIVLNMIDITSQNLSESVSALRTLMCISSFPLDFVLLYFSIISLSNSSLISIPCSTLIEISMGRVTGVWVH